MTALVIQLNKVYQLGNIEVKPIAVTDDEVIWEDLSLTANKRPRKFRKIGKTPMRYFQTRACLKQYR